MAINTQVDIQTLAAIIMAALLAFEGYQRRKIKSNPAAPVAEDLKRIQLTLDQILAATQSSDGKISALWDSHLGPEAKEENGALKWWPGAKIDTVMSMLREIAGSLASLRSAVDHLRRPERG